MVYFTDKNRHSVISSETVYLDTNGDIFPEEQNGLYNRNRNTIYHDTTD